MKSLSDRVKWLFFNRRRECDASRMNCAEAQAMLAESIERLLRLVAPDRARRLPKP